MKKRAVTKVIVFLEMFENLDQIYFDFSANCVRAHFSHLGEFNFAIRLDLGPIQPNRYYTCKLGYTCLAAVVPYFHSPI